MLKLFYRLKRKGGMVLFVVIAVMTLLIAMATTAYFTASSSYKTVVSNYDSSQLYISTTSLADMIIGALTQSTSLAKTEGTTVTSSSDTLLNDYTGLKQAVMNSKAKATTKFNSLLDGLLTTYGGPEKDVNKLIVGEGSTDNEKTVNLKAKADALHTAFTTACKEADPVVGYSHNIYSKASSTDINDFLQTAAEDPVASGIVDGVKITIQLKNMDFETSAGKVTGRYTYYFDVSTTGFYRDNYVTVQDTIYNVSGTASGGSAPDFDAFFKSTGGSSKDGKGERAVILGAEIVSDNAYFENSYTIFGELSGGGNNFYGGITATGSVFFTRQLNCHIPAPGEQLKLNSDGSYSVYSDTTTSEARHDWIIKGDLGLLSSNTLVDLNGNDLYVDGDLIIGNQGGSGLKANKVFVNGNIYLLSDTAEINANEIYCGGKIMSGKPGTLPLDHYVEVDTDPDPNVEKKEIMTYNEAYPGGVLKADYTLLSTSWNSSTATRMGWNTVQDELDFIYNKMKEACAEANTTYVAPSPNLSDSQNGKLNGKKIYYTRSDCFGTDTDNHNINVGTVSASNTNLSKSYNQYTYTTKASSPTSKGDHYEYKLSGSMSISEMFDESDGVTKAKDWPNYTAEDTTLNNILPIDFTNAPSVKVSVGQEGDGMSSDWEGGNVTVDDDGNTVQRYTKTWNITVNLPNGSTKTVEASARLDYPCTVGADGKITVNKQGFKAVYSFPTTTGNGTATVTLNKAGSDNVYFTADLPYVAKGYQLDLQYPDWIDTQRNRVYNIHTDDTVITDPSTGAKTYSAMPIVLQANYDDGSVTKKDKDGNNAFSWWGYENSSNDRRSIVQLVNNAGDGSAIGTVIFEMGNIDGSGNYNNLDAMNDVVTYRVGQRDFVGTKNQVDGLGVLDSTSFSAQSNVNKLMKTGSNKAVDLQTTPKDYENRVMLVSNKQTKDLKYKADGTIDPDQVKSGIVINKTENLFCGYMYGPDTTFVNPDSTSNTVPVLGGLIVAEYIAGKNHYMYAEPDPNIINSLFSALNSKNKKDKTPLEGYWYLSGSGTGKNYLG